MGVHQRGPISPPCMNGGSRGKIAVGSWAGFLVVWHGACLVLGKSEPKIFSQIVVVRGDESHGHGRIRKKHNLGP